MLARLVRGFGFAWRGLSHLLGNTRLWKWAGLPILLNIFLFVVATSVYVRFFPDLLHKIMARPDVWYLWIVYVLVIVLLVVAFALLVLFTFTMVGCILAAPFLDVLSERVENQLGSLETERSLREALSGMMRGLATSLAMLLLLVATQVAIFAVSFVPVVGQVVALVAGPLSGALFFAIEFFDFPLGRRNLRPRERFGFVNRHRAEAIGFGLAVFLTTLVPLLNFLALPVAAVGATLLVRALEEEDARPPAAR